MTRLILYFVDIPFDFRITVHALDAESEADQLFLLAQPSHLALAQMKHPAGIVKVEDRIALDHIVLFLYGQHIEVNGFQLFPDSGQRR